MKATSMTMSELAAMDGMELSRDSLICVTAVQCTVITNHLLSLVTSLTVSVSTRLDSRTRRSNLQHALLQMILLLTTSDDFAVDPDQLVSC